MSAPAGGASFTLLIGIGQIGVRRRIRRKIRIATR
jgi:hypothetical protein